MKGPAGTGDAAEFLLGDDPVHGSLSGWIAEW
jgi:hypothetical protein